MNKDRHDEYDKLHDEYNERSAEINERVQANPDDWELFMRSADELTALVEELDARHDALDAKQSKPLRNLRNLWAKWGR